MKLFPALVTILFFLSLPGCAALDSEVRGGYLFTYKRVPFTVDLDNTTADGRNGGGRVVQVREPFSGYGIYTELKTNAVADIAREHGMSKVYFADMEIFSVLGIYGHRQLFIHGE